MHGLWQSVVLAFVTQVGAVAAVENLQFCILQEQFQMLLIILLTLLPNEFDGLLECDAHGICILR